MSRLTPLKEYNRVTAEAREAFYSARELANREFYRGLPGATPEFEVVEALLQQRDAAISEAWRIRKEAAAAAWRDHKRGA